MDMSWARSAIPLAVATALAGTPAVWAKGLDDFNAAQKAAFNGQRDQATMLYSKAIRSGSAVMLAN